MGQDTLENGESNLRVMIIGVGGASCSGKTTLAKHLRSLMPSSFIVHQDDFAPPQHLVPVHPKYGIQDWDDPDGAIEWPRMAQELAYVKRHGHHSDDYKTHDHLNKQTPVPVEDDLMEKWKNRFTEIEDNFKKRGERIVWAIVDGFLLYWEPEVYKPMDVKLFLRVPEKTLKDRRDVRDGYITDAAEGGMWKDPPGYFEQIVYPAYVKAHQEVFEDGDVENGQLSRKKVSDLILLDGIALNMTEIVEKTCESIEEAVKAIEASV